MSTISSGGNCHYRRHWQSYELLNLHIGRNSASTLPNTHPWRRRRDAFLSLPEIGSRDSHLPLKCETWGSANTAGPTPSLGPLPHGLAVTRPKLRHDAAGSEWGGGGDLLVCRRATARCLVLSSLRQKWGVDVSYFTLMRCWDCSITTCKLTHPDSRTHFNRKTCPSAGVPGCSSLIGSRRQDEYQTWQGPNTSVP